MLSKFIIYKRLLNLLTSHITHHLDVNLKFLFHFSTIKIMKVTSLILSRDFFLFNR